MGFQPESFARSVLVMTVCESCGQRIGPTAKPTAFVHEAPTPERWHVDEGAGTLHVRWSWFTRAVFFIVPFMLFWNGALIGMGVTVTEGGAHLERLLLGLAVPHVWVGVGLVYWVLATFMNSTAVSLTGNTLSVRHGPLPWIGNRTLDIGDLEQLFVVEKRGSKGRVTFDVCAMKKDRTKQVLVGGLDAYERALGLRDEAVSSEVAKRR
jgi:hypothetical protein